MLVPFPYGISDASVLRQRGLHALLAHVGIRILGAHSAREPNLLQDAPKQHVADRSSSTP